MRWNTTAALIAALVIAIAVVALEWYAHVGAQATVPVSAVTAPPTQGPVVYVPAPAPATVPASTGAPAAPPVPSGTAQPSAAASQAPAAGASAAPASMPSAAPATPGPLNPPGAPLATPAPMTLATLRPGAIAPRNIVPAEPANAPPRILTMSLSSGVARGGQVITGVVRTSSNVASVEARIAGYSSSMRKTGVGVFELSQRVPKLPFFLHRTYSIEVIARNTRGEAVSASIPITVH